MAIEISLRRAFQLYKFDVGGTNSLNTIHGVWQNVPEPEL